MTRKLTWMRMKLIRDLKDMDFFKTITMTTSDPEKQNAVIMGRKTWQSIPENFRPLRNRINIILSRDMNSAPDGTHVARSLPDALSLLSTEELADRVENIHIIGGSSVYQEAMTGSYPCRLYLTRILADFECDAFLPEIDDSSFTKIRNPDNVPTDLHEENGLKFRFEVYDKL
ncbi:dihydrofolate reductase-like isoform X2 [Dreissena polymorpha]|uniref:dihydrofolate reductase-like isoform X2 n=1 Tax=Dreissena polymorpha TaxID=45954 RepID=UPI00226482CC|nr:dihydrofolate reductase-like isoform X2 [Dreissena polymorpha]